MKDLKYLVSYSMPLACVLGLCLRDYWTFFTPIFAFVLIPILEIILPIQNENLSNNESVAKNKSLFFDLLLYLNLPMVYGLLGWFLWSVPWANYSTAELTGLILSVGVVCLVVRVVYIGAKRRGRLFNTRTQATLALGARVERLGSLPSYTQEQEHCSATTP